MFMFANHRRNSQLKLSYSIKKYNVMHCQTKTTLPVELIKEFCHIKLLPPPPLPKKNF